MLETLVSWGSSAAGAEPIAEGHVTTSAHEPHVARLGGHGSASVVAAWRALGEDGPPFQTADFQRLVLRLTGPADVRLAAAVRRDRMVAALPIVRRGRTLHALRSDHSPRFDLAGDAGALPAVWRALRAMPGWDVLELRPVPADSPLATDLPALALADGCAAQVRETHRSPWFELEGIEQRIHRRFRGDMRRLERQLGGVELERIERFDREALADVFRLEGAAWKAAAGTAISCDERLARFYTALARHYARRRRLTIAFLRARGRRIAAQLALEDATTFYLLKVGYDPEYAHFGPGQILVREVAADARRRGLLRYDMMGKDTAWKNKWTDRARAHVMVRIYAPSNLGRARWFVQEVARPLAGRALRAARSARP